MNNKRKAVEKQMTDMFGFAPDFYKALPENALEGAWALHRDFELGETKLDAKTKKLIGLAIASHIRCKYCIHYFTRTSEVEGVTPEEMREAIAMGGTTVMFSNSMTGMKTDFEQFKRDLERVIEQLSSGRKGG